MGSPTSQETYHSVNLYAYDLSNGLARSMSMAWTGRQFEAIWHTSVVFDNQIEVFFGQGIMTSPPGQSYLGPPLKVLDYGKTMIDIGTFMDYIEGLRKTWTAQSYHLLEKNCNNFSNELLGFLTGRSVPEDILNLPREFLSTPLGASMRPMIDQMFRGTNHPPQQSSLPTSASTPSSLISNVASLAYNNSAEAPAVKSLTTKSSLDKELNEHACVVVNFTNERGCPPCRAIAPVYENLANQHKQSNPQSNSSSRKLEGRDIVFIKVDTSISGELSQKFQIRATPTFKFFLKKQEMGEIKGANPTELETQINLLLFTAYPPHPHSKLNLQKLRSLPSEPIQYSQPINYEKALNKLLSSSNLSKELHEEISKTFDSIVIPFLNKKIDLKRLDDDREKFLRWISITSKVLNRLNVSECFPVLDFLRLGSIRVEFIDQVLRFSEGGKDESPIYEILKICDSKLVEDENLKKEKKDQNSRPFSLTVLRLISNLMSSKELSNRLMKLERRSDSQDSNEKEGQGGGGVISKVLINKLLDDDKDVKVLAAGACFGLICRISDERSSFKTLDAQEGGAGTEFEDGRDEEWEIELISALIESLKREISSDQSNYEMIHRLLASIGKLFYLSRFEESLKILIESLELDQILKDLNKKINKDNSHSSIKVVKELSSEILILINS